MVAVEIGISKPSPKIPVDVEKKFKLVRGIKDASPFYDRGDDALM